MELTWTTFFLEAINFLVLVWVLKRLFYVPVKKAIANRRAAVEKTLQDAQSARHEAEDLKSKYEGRLSEWETEKERQREQFRKELNDEKIRQLKLMETSVTQEREKAEAQEEKKAAERRAQEEKQAMTLALEFTARLLSTLASPDLEGKIVDLVVKQIASDKAEALPITALQSQDHRAAVHVWSGFLLSDLQRSALSAALKHKLGAEVQVAFDVNQKLLAGLEVAVGSFMLRANLRDELEYFSAMRNHE